MPDNPLCQLVGMNLVRNKHWPLQMQVCRLSSSCLGHMPVNRAGLNSPNSHLAIPIHAFFTKDHLKFNSTDENIYYQKNRFNRHSSYLLYEFKLQLPLSVGEAIRWILYFGRKPKDLDWGNPISDTSRWT